MEATKELKKQSKVKIILKEGEETRKKKDKHFNY